MLRLQGREGGARRVHAVFGRRLDGKVSVDHRAVQDVYGGIRLQAAMNVPATASLLFRFKRGPEKKRRKK